MISIFYLHAYIVQNQNLIEKSNKYFRLRKMFDLDIIMLTNTKDDNIYKMTCKAIESLRKSEETSFNLILIESNKENNYEYKVEHYIKPDIDFNYNSYLNIGSKYCVSDYSAISNNDVVFHSKWWTNLKTAMIKNNLDTTVILFSTDEFGNVILEKDTKTAAKYYYYYDAKNRLTDVVHTNERTQKPVADYIIDYNSENQMETLKTSESENGNFLIWKYDYENKLRIKERVFSKNEKFMGKIEYQYQ
jgi:hypothetical protein